MAALGANLKVQEILSFSVDCSIYLEDDTTWKVGYVCSFKYDNPSKGACSSI